MFSISFDDNNFTLSNVNFTRIQRVDSTNVNELTKAEILGRKQVIEAINVMRKYMVGFKDICLVLMPANISIRESRHIIGEYILIGDDI